jgi:D-alanine-D-alanine ligase-like ATP-grasp enzyme
VVFEGYRLSFTDRLIAAAQRLHEMTANIGIISWDFTVDAQGEIVVIEANFKGQSVWFPQMLSGEAFYGEQTAQVLHELFRDK